MTRLLPRLLDKTGVDKHTQPKDPKNSGTDWLNRSVLDNSDQRVRERSAFLDAPDVMQGIKARDAVRGRFYAGGQYYNIPGKGETATPVTRESEDNAQGLLDDYKDRIKKGAAAAQNPMLNADDGEGKMTTRPGMGQEAEFIENNASPTEMKPMMQNTPYGGYVNGKPVDLESSNTPRNLRYTLTPEEVDEGLANGTLDQMQSELRPLPQN